MKNRAAALWGQTVSNRNKLLSSKGLDDQKFVESWDLGKLARWYERGKKKVDKELRIEVLINRLLNLDLYVREMMELNLNSMSRIQMNHHKVVTIDTESSGYNTDDEEIKNAADDCEHPDCHRVDCKINNAKMPPGL